MVLSLIHPTHITGAVRTDRLDNRRITYRRSMHNVIWRNSSTQSSERIIQLLRAEREARSESTSIYRRKVSMSGRPAGRGHAL